MKPKPSQLELEVPLIRNENEWLREAEHLADMLAVVDGLREDMSTEVRKRRKEIKAREREVSNTARALREGRGNRKQTDLFPSEAQRALHDVAARSEAKKPLPSEAHKFEGKPSSECMICGALKDDPIHGKAVLVAEGLKVAGEMPDGKGRDLVEALARTVGGDPVEDVVQHVKSRRAGNGKEPHEPVSKARTRPKGPLSRKARARGRV